MYYLKIKICLPSLAYLELNININKQILVIILSNDIEIS